MKYSTNDLLFPKNKVNKQTYNCKLKSTNSIHATHSNVEIKYIDLHDRLVDKTEKLGLNCQIKTATNDYPKFYMSQVGQISVGKFEGRNFTCTNTRHFSRRRPVTYHCLNVKPVSSFLIECILSGLE